jgi:hypothetical protein
MTDRELYRQFPPGEIPSAMPRRFDGEGKIRYAYILAIVSYQHSAPVAQLDRVLVSETKGHRFDSCRAHHSAFSPRLLANASKMAHATPA